MTTIVEGFSISHAAILDGATGLDLDFGDIYGVREGSLSVDEGNFDNTGDDGVLSSWFWFNHVNVTVKSGYMPFSLMSILTGNTISSSGGGSPTYELPLWTQSSLNAPPRPMRIRVPSRDSAGASRTLDIILYKVQFSPIKFEGPAYKAGLLVDYTGRALIADTDEKGNALADHAIGRLVSTAA